MFVRSGEYLYFSKYCDDGRARVSLGIKINKDSKVLDFSRLKESEQLTVNRIKEAVIKYEESSNRMQVKILKDELEGVVLTAIGRDRGAKRGFIADFNKVITTMRDKTLLKFKTKTPFSESTAIAYENCLICLEAFSQDTGTPLTYNIDSTWFNALMVWFVKNKYSKNSIATIGNNFRGFLTITYRAGKHKNLFHKSEEFAFSQEDADGVALSEDEIKTLYALKLRVAAGRARDVFVFACWVGLRAKDLRRINNYKIRGNVFEFLASKNGEKVIIPVHPIAREIFEKYAGNMPVLNSTNFHYHICEICKKAKFNEQHLITMTLGGERKGEYYAKHDLVSPHSARRSFATNAYMAGIPVLKIMKITGHKTESAFMKYIKIKKEENAQELAEHPFFKG
ncbi:tyrosine-type recombinase/integrase [Chitinophaga sp. CC14]|uniref:tyrosine-type recombinase/integrase n=1 Tax=Chitinophaga sp. CC14 TaxID=3029199 RepID=UPI003B78492B